MKVFLIVSIIVIFLLIVMGAFLYFSAKQSREMEVKSSLKEDGLSRCESSSSNCYFREVSISPSLLDNSFIESLEAKNYRLIEKRDHYLHFEVETSFMRFVDDLEIFTGADLIQFRSQSRVGKSDLGANKKRVDHLVDSFAP